MANRAVSAPVRLNCFDQALMYIDYMLSKDEDLKVLLCDDATRNILSVAYSQRQLLKHNVVLVDMLSNPDRYQMRHFKCVIFCRPSPASLASIYQELAEFNFASYTIFFPTFVDQTLMQSLANGDIFNVVGSIEEVYLDSNPITEYVCVVQLKPPPLKAEQVMLVNPIRFTQWDSASLTRMAEAIISMMLFTKRRPVIRYRGGNKLIEKLSRDVAERMKQVHQGFADLKAKESVLLILDRMDDPVTPLVMPWTYEAMIHEVIGFQRGNEVTIDDPDAPPEERVHVLTPETDSFFAQHRYSDYGKVCLAVSELVKTYKALNNFDRTSGSLEEIKTFMARFPEARKQSMQVTRHCGIASELVTEVNNRNLTKLSVLEQEMLETSNIADHSRMMLDVVQDPKTDIDDALRITMLYNLRYEKMQGNVVEQLKEELRTRQCPPNRLALIDKIVECAGSQYRLHDLFRGSTGHLFKAVVKSVGQFGRDVQDVATQHTPLLKKLVNRAYNGTLAEQSYPVQAVPGSPIPTGAAASVRGKDIIVVMIGGTTYEEAMLLYNINQGQMDNNVEALMNIGKNVSRFVGSGDGSGGAGVADEPYTAKIQARVTLLTTAMINSKEFLQSIP